MKRGKRNIFAYIFQNVSFFKTRTCVRMQLDVRKIMHGAFKGKRNQTSKEPSYLAFYGRKVAKTHKCARVRVCVCARAFER